MEVFLGEEAFYQEVGIKDLGWEMGLPDYWCGSREGNPPGDPIRLPGLGPLVLHTFFASSAMLWSRARKSAGDEFGVDGMLAEDGGQGPRLVHVP